MIALTADASAPDFALPDLCMVRCGFAYDAAGLAGETALRAPDGTWLALPADLQRAVPKRQAEYLAGRWCAARALRRFAAAEQVAVQPDRSPGWPAGFVGSISHAQGRALAVVARGDDYRALGVDIETELDPATAAQLEPMLLQADETALRPAGWPQARFLTLAFSAKETLYKAVYPHGRRILEFHDARLLAIGAGELELALLPDHRPATLPDARYRVAYRFDGNQCLTLLALPQHAMATVP
ncbi:4'-phosphopantetheinyl transferase family protein [Chitinimonas koreensis]|uniref:4'-phosphopantetheinyl transferase family protein n=1 Tax=Chitinimonas koreensis TaxID=356302 RepID=UPI0004131FC0|nr:4'-phosphopantetheinyl transferase superfamily protein [Chitinimonas koreensis]QNM95087.1 4'-phosphopantetheinyl transferase superfamily protein [Chitinimonas koreensis]QPB41101.1 4'-phosphopantetheinyl transferase superfamily protein [Chitinimonas sp.]